MNNWMFTDADTLSFGATLRAAREAAGITQAQLGELLRIDRVCVHHAERGRRPLTQQRISLLPDAIAGPIARWLIDWHRRQTIDIERRLFKCANGGGTDRHEPAAALGTHAARRDTDAAADALTHDNLSSSTPTSIGVGVEHGEQSEASERAG